MADEIKKRMDEVSMEIVTRKRQLQELRFNYEFHKQRLAQVERQLNNLEDTLDQLAQGQLPLLPDELIDA